MSQRRLRSLSWCGFLVLVVSGVTPFPLAESSLRAESMIVQGDGSDWVSWRGPEQSGVSRVTGLPETFDLDGDRTNLVWTRPEGCRSTPVAHDGQLYIIHLTGTGKSQKEEVVAFDAATGEIRWRHAFNVFLTDIPSTRVGWSHPAVDPETGNVYVHGVQGLLICLSRDGKKVWERSLNEEFGLISGYGGRTHTPVVDEDRVVLSFLNSSWGDQSRGAHRYVAFDKFTGRVVWWATPGGQPLDTTYSTPIVTVIDGVRTLVAGNADGAIYGMKARTGETLWKFALSKRGINSSVVADGDLVYACHSEDNLDAASLGRVVCFRARGTGDITKTAEVWRADERTVGYSSPAIHEGRLYVCDNSANLIAFDSKTGRQIWTHSLGTVMKASPVVADGKVYLGDVSGRFSIVGIDGEKPRTLCLREFLLPDGRPREINGSAAVADGRVYFTTFTDIYCIGRKDWKPTEITLTSPTEPESASDAAGTHLQIVPGEVALVPGQRTYFTARLFDASGRFLRNVQPEWSFVGLKGTIEGGRLEIPAESGYQAGLLVASHGGMKSNARVRVVPALPISIDFEEYAVGDAPIGWIGASKVKFQVKELDGSKVLEKLGQDPRFILADAFFGLPTATGYVVESDVRVGEKRFQLPNVGVFGQRYELTLMGNAAQLRLASWVPMPRVQEKVDFEIEPDLWYRMKLSVTPRGADAVVRGKVWKRDDAEPADWTLELVDPSPNLSGAAGLSGYSAGSTDVAPGAPIYWDNLRVSPAK